MTAGEAEADDWVCTAATTREEEAEEEEATVDDDLDTEEVVTETEEETPSSHSYSSSSPFWTTETRAVASPGALQPRLTPGSFDRGVTVHKVPEGQPVTSHLPETHCANEDRMQASSLSTGGGSVRLFSEKSEQRHLLEHGSVSLRVANLASRFFASTVFCWKKSGSARG